MFRGMHMKARLYATLAAAMLALGACAHDGSYDAQTHEEVGQVLDAATQILQMVIQGVQTFGQ